jgi:hypothetical protein
VHCLVALPDHHINLSQEHLWKIPPLKDSLRFILLVLLSFRPQPTKAATKRTAMPEDFWCQLVFCSVSGHRDSYEQNRQTRPK